MMLLPCCLALAAPAAFADCVPAGWDLAKLRALKEHQFAVDEPAARASLANALLDCLASPDPELRDGIAFEAWQTWLRADQLDEATRRAALARLQPAIDPARADAQGFAQPFSALVLGELARSDRKQPWLTPAQRAALVEASARYVESVRDYRGFVAGEGWRHGVAHGADLLMQLALNPALDRPQLDRILAAVASQVAPKGQAYVFGEPERLARPVLYAASRDLIDEDDWSGWFSRLCEAPDGGWDGMFVDGKALPRRHDLRYFLLSLHEQALEQYDEPGVRKMLPGLEAQLRVVP
jgi:hypothetical protein